MNLTDDEARAIIQVIDDLQELHRKLVAAEAQLDDLVARAAATRNGLVAA